MTGAGGKEKKEAGKQVLNDSQFLGPEIGFLFSFFSKAEQFLPVLSLPTCTTGLAMAKQSLT